MLVQFSWLQEYIDVPWSAHELAAKLTNIGQMVEGIRQFGGNVSGIVAGRIEEVHSHPTADRLLVCAVNLGGRRITVVTGAPNVVKGMIAPVALPGARVVGQEEPITAADFRGVESYGMLCAEDELGISDDHSGIMALPPDTELGSDLASLMQLGDAILEFEIYPNRPDCQSIVGIAREAAALTGGTLRIPIPAPIEEGEAASELAKVTVEATDLCPRYCARVIRGVRIGPSPLWMQQRLRAAGMRPINNVVDVTNYVMLELGQPLHAFDLSLVAGRHIIVRRAKPGESIVTLDGQQRHLDPSMLVIADAEKPVAIAGVMGGESSEVRSYTTDLLLESANFDFVTVRKTSRQLGLRTEASARFEKGLDPSLAVLAANRAAELLARLCGGQVAPGLIDVAQPLTEPSPIILRPDKVNAILGTEVSSQQMWRCLESLGFDCKRNVLGDKQKECISVSVPSFRLDVTREIDLVEEIARIYGYDRITPTLPQEAAAVGGLGPAMRLVERVRNACVSAGLHETLTYSFTSPRHSDMLRLPSDDWHRRAIPLANPLSEELSLMRTTLMGNLMEALGRNAARQTHVAHLFEIGAVFLPKEWPPVNQPEERRTLAIAMTGDAPGAWGSRTVDFFTLKGILELLAKELALELHVVAGRHPALHPGRCGEIMLGGAAVGLLGEMHPEVQAAYELPGRAYYLELNIDAVLPHAGRMPTFMPLPKYPAVVRDLALLVPLEMPAERVVARVRSQAGGFLESIELFDVYQGKPVPEQYRSLAYSLTFRAPDRTLVDTEVNACVARVEQALAADGVILRR